MSRVSIRTRIVAFLSLAALFCSWAHVHVERHQEFAAASLGDLEQSLSSTGNHNAKLSSDDAHHEHSSRATLETEVCFACRSKSESEWDRAGGIHSAIESVSAGFHPKLAHGAPRAIVRGVHPPRAPPASLMPATSHT
jgi:hypothetical protein